MMYILRLKNNLLSENANHLLGRSGGGISGETGIDIYTSGRSVVKNLPANAGDRRDTDSIPGLGRFSGVGNVNHFNILAQELLWIEKPGRLQSI